MMLVTYCFQKGKKKFSVLILENLQWFIKSKQQAFILVKANQLKEIFAKDTLGILKITIYIRVHIHVALLYLLFCLFVWVFLPTRETFFTHMDT